MLRTVVKPALVALLLAAPAPAALAATFEAFVGGAEGDIGFWRPQDCTTAGGVALVGEVVTTVTGDAPAAAAALDTAALAPPLTRTDFGRGRIRSVNQTNGTCDVTNFLSGFMRVSFTPAGEPFGTLPDMFGATRFVAEARAREFVNLDIRNRAATLDTRDVFDPANPVYQPAESFEGWLFDTTARLAPGEEVVIDFEAFAGVRVIPLPPAAAGLAAGLGLLAAARRRRGRAAAH